MHRLTIAVALVIAPALTSGSQQSPSSARGTASPDSLAPFMAPGVSLELAGYRARQIRDVRYVLTLDLTARDTAKGRVIVAFDRVQPGDVILDFRGPSLGTTRVNGRTLDRVEFNGAHIRIPDSALVPRLNEIELDFTAAIAPAGASIIRVDDPTDGNRYLYTLLVPADANQLFPSFDQPDLKARFTLNLLAPRGWSAVSNGALGRSYAGDERSPATFAFAETQPISTYLFAFAAGPWERVSRTVQGREMSLYVRRSRAKEVEADSLIAINLRALAWLEDWFAHPYPFGKLDMVLAPAFPFGGMEHPGAIFYSEDRFIFRERPTLTQLLGRKATIYHEVAHQWFGDLVTMRWFDDLWLKEGFATYMAAKMQDALDPGTEAWKTFYLRNKPLAYGVDVTEGTTPVWQELANLDQAKSNYGPIVYNKAPAILKQLNYLVGDSAFRSGVRGFLRQHRFGNATWRDLLASIGGAAGRPLEPWGAQFILRPGMPVVEQHLEVRGDTIARLALVQRPARPMSGGGAWPMRVEVLLAWENAAPVRIPVEMSAETTHVAAAVGRRAPAFVFANAGDHGYALTLPDARSVAWLERNIGTVDDAMLRAMLWGAMWDLVRDARLEPARFALSALRELRNESDEQIIASLLNQTTRAVTAYMSEEYRTQIQLKMQGDLLMVALHGQQSYGVRKLHLDALIRVAESPLVLTYLDSLLDGGTVVGAPLGAPTRWAIVTQLVEQSAPMAEARLAAETRRDSTAEGARRAFVAGAARADAETKRRYFERYLRDSTLNEDWATASLGAFNSLGQQDLTLRYLRPALDTLPWIQQNRRIFFLGSWLGAFLGGHTSPEALGVVRSFVVESPELPADLRLKVLQAADELERTVRIRAAFGRR